MRKAGPRPVLGTDAWVIGPLQELQVSGIRLRRFVKDQPWHTVGAQGFCETCLSDLFIRGLR